MKLSHPNVWDGNCEEKNTLKQNTNELRFCCFERKGEMILYAFVIHDFLDLVPIISVCVSAGFIAGTNAWVMCWPVDKQISQNISCPVVQTRFELTLFCSHILHCYTTWQLWLLIEHWVWQQRRILLFRFSLSPVYLQGLKFDSFPYLLTLQLKRFAFDFATLHRIKLNDRWVVNG